MSNTRTIRGVVLRESPKALLVKLLDYEDEEAWIPLSQIEQIDRETEELEISEWFARKIGL